MRERSTAGTPDHHGSATGPSRGSTALMPCHVEFSMLGERMAVHSSPTHSRSSSLSSSASDSINFLIEGMDIQDNYGVEEKYSKDEDYLSSYSCGKTFIIHKQSKDETLGIELGKATKYGGVFVTLIEPTSKFAYTGLKPGMQILSINNRPCPVDFRTVAFIMKETVGDLKISAIDSSHKKSMAMAIQKKANRQRKQKHHRLKSSQLSTDNSIKREGSTRSAQTWSPETHSRADLHETREAETGNELSEEERCAPPSSTSKLAGASPRALASEGARLVSNWIRSKRYYKMKGNHPRRMSSSFAGSSRRLTRRSSSLREELDDDECSTDGLLKKIPSALAFDDIVQEGLGPTSDLPNEVKLSKMEVSKISKEYYEANGMCEI